MQINKEKCPECGIEIDLVPKAGDPNMLQGFCNCKGSRRAVYEIHASLLKKEDEVEETTTFSKPYLLKKKGGSHA